ncbi:MAG: hypothetical protein ABJI69_09205 [Balneola sp.]
MNEFELFWDNVDQHLDDNKSTTGLNYVVRGSFAKKPTIKPNQSTTWIQFNPSSIGVHNTTVPVNLSLTVFVTGATKTNVHQTHLGAVIQAVKIARLLHGFSPLPGDDKNSGCTLSLNKDDSFEVVEDNPRAYTIAVVFNAHLNISN